MTSVNSRITFPMILFLAAAVGYISLSQEILWMRILGYASGNAPEIFGHVLGVFLFGIAFGALLGSKITKSETINLGNFIALILVISGLIYFFSIPIIALFREKEYMTSEAILPRGQQVSFLLIWLIAFLQGSLLTVISHLGIRKNQKVGHYISWVYLANIIGSTAGPLITGFVILEHFSIERNIVMISIASIVLGTFVSIKLSPSTKVKIIVMTLSLSSLVVFGLTYDTLNYRLLEKLHGWKYDTYSDTVQNRSGIIAVHKKNNKPAIVYGDGMYDGKFNVDPANDVNGIHRAYAIAALHAEPSKLLSIGLSTGSWVRVLANYGLINEITVVEINSGYEEIISKNPEQSVLLENDKVSIYYDDGRRWLKRNPEEKFDFILMNTTWHWRSMSSNLTSIEFMSLVKSHLLPGGVMYINTTGSKSIPYTASKIFKHVTEYSNFIAASDSSFQITKQQRKDNLSKFIQNGKIVFEKPETKDVFNKIVSAPLRDIYPKRSSQADIITDDNMLVEYKINRRSRSKAYQLERGWVATLKRAFAN